MKHLPTTLLSLLLLAALAAPASAQPAGADQPASTSEPPPGELSHINGEPVKVGEHNEYYYDFKRWNVSANPLGWIVGIYGVSVSYGFHDNVAFRADANLFDFPDSESRGTELGVGLPIYLRRTYQGPFLEPGVIVRSFENEFDDDVDTTLGPQVLVGWHWTWDSGFNLALAAGAGRNISGDKELGDGEIFANGYLRFGYNF